MPVRHIYTSPQADVGDPTLVQPSDWNSAHAYTLQDAVSLSGNTAGVLANLSSGTLYLAGGNNVTLSQDGNSVTLSAFNQSLQTQSRFNLTLGGNTSGALALISSGVMTLAGGNNITLSQAGNAVTLSAANSGTAPPIGTTVNSIATANSAGTVTRFAPEDHRHEGLYAGGVSTGGNTAGNTTVQAGRIVFAGGNNITLSVGTAANALQTITISAANETQTVPPIGTAVKGVSSVGSTGTITRFAPEDHQHAGVFSAGVSNVGNTSGDTVVFPGRLVLAGGDQITLSVATAAGNLMTVTISGATAGGVPSATTVQSVASANSVGTVTRYAAEDHRHAGIYQISVGGNTAGNTSAGAGSLVLAGGDNITLSGATAAGGMTLTVSAAAGGAGGLSAGVSNVGNTSGTTGLVATRMVLVGGPNVTLSQSVNGVSATLTVSAGATWPFYEVNGPPAVPVYSWTRFPQQPVFLPFDVLASGLSVKTLRVLMSRPAGTSLVVSHAVGFYTLVNATQLTRVSSTSQQYSLTATSLFGGVRVYDVTGLSDMTLTEGRWYLGIHLSATATAQGNVALMGPAAVADFTAQVFPGSNSTGALTASTGLLPFQGVLSMSSAGMPDAVAMSDMLGGAGSTQVAYPWVAIRQI